MKKKLVDKRKGKEDTILCIGILGECVKFREKNFDKADHPKLVIMDVVEGDEEKFLNQYPTKTTIEGLGKTETIMNGDVKEDSLLDVKTSVVENVDFSLNLIFKGDTEKGVEITHNEKKVNFTGDEYKGILKLVDFFLG